ncbi:putative RNA recognition motif domain, nucleotide-binding alpha-beta plait domain superfamily [Helianthus annuus]|nr:putative RNA recognition motif domain, nucleotide-binding alpha-beta plait domain superfamily [Helianthus annuus]
MGSRRKLIPVEILARITKFYVTNIPDNCSGANLAREVRNFGEIFDIYVARKRDKVGRRFAFVSLLDVKDRREMEKVLSSIRLGEYKLKVNVARFVLEEGEVNDRRSFFPPKNERPEKKFNAEEGNRRQANQNTFHANAMSFKEAFSGASRGKSIEVEDSVCAFESLHGRSLVLKVCSLEVLQRVKRLLEEMKLGEGEVRYLGGFLILVTFRSKEHAKMALEELVGRPELFCSVVVWEGQDLPFERVAWLKVYGIPLSLLAIKVFDSIGAFFGSVVKKPTVDRMEIDSSFHYIGVMVGHGARIKEELFLKWRGKTLKIWVEEDDKDWISDYVDEVDDV